VRRPGDVTIEQVLSIFFTDESFTTPLWNMIRGHGPNAKSCWDLFHTEEDLFNGPASTMCDIANPEAELHVAPTFMSKKKPKK
jgi:hypothetical protein